MLIFFYNLPRFSVDLDFDLLLSGERQQEIFAIVCAILKTYGTLKDARIKRYTIFTLLSYGDADCNIKIEINIRALEPNIRDYFVCRKYIGISMLVAKKEYLSTCIAVVERIQYSQILSGLGELISPQEKIWAKAHLKEEVLFMLRNYLAVFALPQ